MNFGVKNYTGMLRRHGLEYAIDGGKIIVKTRRGDIELLPSIIRWTAAWNGKTGYTIASLLTYASAVNEGKEL